MDEAWSVLMEDLGLEESSSELERTKTLTQELAKKDKEIEDERATHAQELAEKDKKLKEKDEAHVKEMRERWSSRRVDTLVGSRLGSNVASSRLALT